MAKPPVRSRILSSLRTIAGLKQHEVEARAGYPEGSVSYYERRQEPPEDVLAELVDSMDYPRFLIDRSRDLIETADAARQGAAPADPEEVARRELDDRAWAAFRDLQSRIDALTEAWLEHREAPYLWRRLARASPRTRLAKVRQSRDFWSPGLCALVCEMSVAAAARDPREAEELARLALEIARRVPGGEERRARLAGLAHAVLGNALRVRSQLPAADAMFAEANRLWTRGAGAFHELLDPSRILDLEASLRLSQRRLSHAEDLLERALPLARSARARGRILLLHAWVLEEKGECLQALALLDRAELEVMKSGEPFYKFVFAKNRLLLLMALGRIGEAASGLPKIRALVKCLPGVLPAARCRWLEGRLAVAQGQVEEAVAAFREVREVFAASECPYDCALVHLDLAMLLLAEGQASEVKEMVLEMEPIFASQGVHREALATLRLFIDAARQEQATSGFARDVLDFLLRSRYNDEIHFRPKPGAPNPGGTVLAQGKGAQEGGS